jgi:hypothetical protein
MASIDMKGKPSTAQGKCSSKFTVGKRVSSSLAGDNLKQAPLKTAATSKKKKRSKSCARCGMHSKNLMKCAGCFKVSYCSQPCQKSDWKAHKTFCKAIQQHQQKELPLTWAQLESYGGLPARGKYLEVNFVQPEAGLRLVAQCRDAEGEYRHVAAHTSSRNLPNFCPGKTFRWKDPRYHYFNDGSGGARIEYEDLEDIQLL